MVNRFLKNNENASKSHRYWLCVCHSRSSNLAWLKSMYASKKKAHRFRVEYWITSLLLFEKVIYSINHKRWKKNHDCEHTLCCLCSMWANFDRFRQTHKNFHWNLLKFRFCAYIFLAHLIFRLSFSWLSTAHMRKRLQWKIWRLEKQTSFFFCWKRREWSNVMRTPPFPLQMCKWMSNNYGLLLGRQKFMWISPNRLNLESHTALISSDISRGSNKTQSSWELLSKFDYALWGNSYGGVCSLNKGLAWIHFTAFSQVFAMKHSFFSIHSAYVK